VVKHVDAVELRVVAAAVLAAAADALFVSHHLPKVGANLVTALARLHVRSLTQRSSLEAGTREKKYGEEQGKARVSERERKWFCHFSLRSRTKRSGCARVRSRNICFGHV
jgi:hypothetical protein